MNILPTVPVRLLWLLALPALAGAEADYSTPYYFTTLAGESSIGSADGAGRAARFFNPSGVAVDSAGNLFVADTGNHTIRKVTPAGVVSTFAGTPGFNGSADGPGNTARFRDPEGVAADDDGNLLVADAGNNTIRKITPDGVVTTLAGKAGAFGSADGIGVDALFNHPNALTIDAADNVFVVDSWNETIRKISGAGVVTTLAGLAANSGRTDGSGHVARFQFVYGVTGITVDSSGTLYVSEETIVRKGQLAGPPVILTQPQSQTVATGGDVRFTVTARGVPEPTYQWFKNGNPFIGATANTLDIINARSSDADDYKVTITNEFGSVTSAKATLTVTPAPVPAARPPPALSGGGGSPSIGFLLTLGALAALRLCRHGN